MNAVAFEYSILRAVPRVDRGEFVNVGVVVYCQVKDYLEARSEVDDARLLALDPDADVAGVVEALDAFSAACTINGGGGLGATTLGERFRWLTAPRSTVVQAGPVHAGLTEDPAAELDRLVDQLVR